jgi:hypothetical protein
MTQIPSTPDAAERPGTGRMTVSADTGGAGEPAISVQPLDAVRREFRRSRRSSTSDRWGTSRLSEQLPRLALHEALEILLQWRGDSRFNAGAVAWHARLAGHASQLTLEDSERALTALGELGDSSPDVGALALRALCERYRLAETAAVLDAWLAERQSYGGL